MPKNTFFNLSEDKRTLICNVATEEFAAYSFEQASVNRIVTKAGIAKGSFYQYFENKKDLYLYILQRASEAKLTYLAPVIRNPEQHDFFTLLHDLYIAGIQFATNYPLYTAISKNLLRSSGTPIYKEAMSANMPAAYELFANLLQEAIHRGEIRDNLDIKMFAHLIASLNTLVLEYYTEHVASEYDDELLATADQFIDFLKYGLGAKQDPVQSSGTDMPLAT